jgi:hypothetical protein
MWKEVVDIRGVIDRKKRKQVEQKGVIEVERVKIFE